MKTIAHKAARMRRVVLSISQGRYGVFAKANKLIERWTGKAPGTEALILRRIEGESSAEEYAELYCFHELGNTLEEIDAYRRGERWGWEI